MCQKTTTLLKLRFILCLENKTARRKKTKTKPGGSLHGMAKEVDVLGLLIIVLTYRATASLNVRFHV